MNRTSFILFILALLVAACGGSPVYADTFHAAVLGISRVETQTAPLKTCTGVMIAPDWVLTSRACQSGSALRVSMPDSRSGGSPQAGVSAEAFSFQDPAVDAMLVRLAAPFNLSASRGPRSLSGASAVAGQLVYCFGIDPAGSMVHAAKFRVNTAQVSNTNQSTTGQLTISDPSGIGRFEPGDQGGPCVLDAAYDFTLSPVAAVLSSAVNQVSKATAGESLRVWISDMMLLSRVRRGNRPFAVINRHSGLQLDVAWASLKQNEAVNQYANNDGLNQLWLTDDTLRVTDFFRVVSANSGKCLEAGGDHRLHQNSCTTAPSQLFTVEYMNPGVLMHARSYLTECLDVPGFSTSNGVQVQSYPCNRGANQVWDWRYRLPPWLPPTPPGGVIVR